MQVPSSAYLQRVRPLLQELLAALDAQFACASILAQDSYAKHYSVSARGVTAAEDDLFTARGFVVRVQDAKGCGEYSFNHIDRASIPAIVDRISRELLPLSEGLPAGIGYIERTLPAGEKLSFVKSTAYVIDPETLGDQTIIEHLTRVREAGKAEDGRILDCQANAVYQKIHKIFLSKDRELEQNILWTSGSVMMCASRGEEIKISYRGFSALGGAEVLDEMDGAVGGIAKTVLELLDSQPITPGEYECICTPSVTGMIVHEAFGHGVEMDMFVKDRALARSFVGEVVASPLVTMHDTPCAADETGSYFFDDEGTPARDTVIIEKGVLKRGISDLLSAAALGTEPTGNGRRESFERKAYTRMTNTYFEGGTDRVEDMIASVSYGFLLDEPSSGMEDPKNWGIQCMVSYAREIRDGKLTGRIFSPIVLTGHVPDLLKSITMMSPAVRLEGGGMCGKGYKEWVKVSDGGPYIKAKIRLG